MERDAQYNLALQATEVLNLVAANIPETVEGTGVDTQGFGRGIVFGLQYSRALVAGDDITYKFQSSSDNGSTDAWADLPAESYLPTFKQAAGNTLEAPVSPYVQTCGVACGERYIRLVLLTTAMTADMDITVQVVLKAASSEFTGWTTTVIPTGGKP